MSSVPHKLFGGESTSGRYWGKSTCVYQEVTLTCVKIFAYVLNEWSPALMRWICSNYHWNRDNDIVVVFSFISSLSPISCHLSVSVPPDNIREYRKRPVAWNGSTKNKLRRTFLLLTLNMFLPPAKSILLIRTDFQNKHIWLYL